jgi:serralysin
MALVIGKKPAGETLDGLDGVTDGIDLIIGNAGADIIYGLGGDDTIMGGLGADKIYGGDGFDVAAYEDSAVGVTVSLQSGKGADGTAAGDTLTSIEGVSGSGHDDTLAGNTGNNMLYGNGGNDVLKGGGGADKLIGGAGHDTMHIDGTDDIWDGGSGSDALVLDSDVGLAVHLGFGKVKLNTDGPGFDGEGYGHGRPNGPFQPGWGPSSNNAEHVFGSHYDDEIYGSDAVNALEGGHGDDVVVGFGGNDILSGGQGNDWICGGHGADLLGGGAGVDRFVFTDLGDSIMVGGKPQDVIADFQLGTDKLDLSPLELDLNLDLHFVVLENQSIGGVSHTFIGLDGNGNNMLDDGEFAVAVAGAFAAGNLIL